MKSSSLGISLKFSVAGKEFMSLNEPENLPEILEKEGVQ